MRNLLRYPITTIEIADHLDRAAERELEKERIGDMAPLLFRAAAKIVIQEEKTVASLRGIIAAMRCSDENVPPRFIEMVEAAIPLNNELGLPELPEVERVVV